MKLFRITAWALCLILLGATGCAGSPRENASAAKAAAPTSSNAAATDRNACHLLSHEEVSALVEEKIVMRDQTDAGETWSTCQWEDENGVPLFILTVYWAGGKQEWDTWRAARGLADESFKKAEGVSTNDIVKQGLVAGLGDAAYFSELLPSLVLKGDVLFEMNLLLVPRAETKFASLARKLLAKIK